MNQYLHALTRARQGDALDLDLVQRIRQYQRGQAVDDRLIFGDPGWLIADAQRQIQLLEDVTVLVRTQAKGHAR